MDYYLKTTSKQDFIQDLQRAGIEITLDNNYYQNENLIIDWIGKIPLPIELDEEGNLIGEIQYYEGEHVNIRSINQIDVSKFENTVDVYPEPPYRMFS
jgi:hypothetical protein